MGLGSLVKRTAQGLGLAAGMGAAMVGGAVEAIAAEIIPLGAVRVEGNQGSDWHDEQLIMDRGQGCNLTVYLTERGESFDAATDPQLSLVLQPGETRTLDDFYAQMKPGSAGAGTLRFVVHDGEAPIWRSRVFNKDGDAEFGMTSKPLSDENYHADKTVGIMLSSQGFRDNYDLTSGANGLAGNWRYKNGAGGNEVVVPADYAPNTTIQGSVRNLIGFDPEANGSLEFEITDGSGLFLLSRNHNTSNDPSRDEFEEVTPYTPSLDDAIAYVNKWLPEARVYLSNTEIRAMINGGTGTQGYATEMAEIIYSDYSDAFDDVVQTESWLRSQVNNNSSGEPEATGEFDPFLWDNDVYGDPGVVFYQEQPPGSLNSLNLSPASMSSMYDLVRGLTLNNGGFLEENGGFLVNYVRNNPSHYGGTVGGQPNIDLNPTWNTQDPN